MTLEQLITARLKTKPYPFQVEGVRFLERRSGRAIIGDDMGLGKTYQTITYLALHPEALPVVVVCPASLKYTWQREFWTHAKMEAEIVEGSHPYDLDGNIWIVNYEILKNWLSWFEETGKPKTLVLDEVHKIKNPTAIRTRAAKELSKITEYILELSGTVITNRPIEFFPALNIIDPKKFNSMYDYGFRFCDPKPGWRGRGWDFSGASNLDVLYETIKPYMIRRTKAEVLKDLPQKTRTIIPVDICNRKEYEKAKLTFLQWLGEKKGLEAVKRARSAEAVVKLGQLKHLAAEGKLPAVIEWIKDYEETGEKLVTFSVHHSVTNALMKAFPHAERLDGTVPNSERNRAVVRFQTQPDCRLLFAGLEVGGVGLTLTAAHTVMFPELGWVPTDHDQAEDRVLRIGQKADHVDAYYFVANDTVEEQVMATLERKRKVVGQVLDGRDTSGDVPSKIIATLIAGAPKKLGLDFKDIRRIR